MNTDSSRREAYAGVIFDFNGTLFWDTPLHNRAWDAFLERHGIFLSDAEKTRVIHGRNNRTIFEDLLGRRLAESELADLIEEKETVYRDRCRRESPGLAPGAAPFLDFLADRGIPRTIATASGRANVKFFFEFLGLTRWFSFPDVVWDDNRIQGKPAPDYYLAAARKLALSAAVCLVFEDSFAGIRAAQNAHAGRIIIVDSTGQDYRAFGHQVITDFSQVDRSVLSSHPATPSAPSG